MKAAEFHYTPRLVNITPSIISGIDLVLNEAIIIAPDRIINIVSILIVFFLPSLS